MRKKSEGGATLDAGIVFPNLHQLRRSQGSPASLAWAVVVVLVDCESVFHVPFSVRFRRKFIQPEINCGLANAKMKT